MQALAVMYTAVRWCCCRLFSVSRRYPGGEHHARDIANIPETHQFVGTSSDTIHASTCRIGTKQTQSTTRKDTRKRSVAQTTTTYIKIGKLHRKEDTVLPGRSTRGKNKKQQYQNLIPQQRQNPKLRLPGTSQDFNWHVGSPHGFKPAADDPAADGRNLSIPTRGSAGCSRPLSMLYSSVLPQQKKIGGGA